MSVANKSVILTGSLLLGILTAMSLKAQISTSTSADTTGKYFSLPKAYVAQKGYWDLHTDYKQLTTTVQFYNANDQLIHQEHFPGQYIKLTRRNTKLLDQVLNRLLTPASIHGQITPTPFPKDNRLDFYSQVREKPEKINTDLNFVTFPIRDEKIMIIFKNPGREKVSVRLEDEKGNDLMLDISTLTHYQRSLVLNQLPEGMYQLTIRGRYKQYVRTLLVKHVPARSSVHLLEDIIQ